MWSGHAKISAAGCCSPRHGRASTHMHDAQCSVLRVTRSIDIADVWMALQRVLLPPAIQPILFLVHIAAVRQHPCQAVMRSALACTLWTVAPVDHPLNQELG